MDKYLVTGLVCALIGLIAQTILIFILKDRMDNLERRLNATALFYSRLARFVSIKYADEEILKAKTEFEKELIN